MSSVLATKITKTMINRAGYIPIETIADGGGFLGLMDDDFMYYTFKDCLKVDTTDFHKWICYWEGYPFAIICDVKADKLVTGFTKVAVLNKTVVHVSEVGEFIGKRNVFFGQMLNGKLQSTKDITNYVIKNMGTVDVSIANQVHQQKKEKVILSNNEISKLKAEMEKNWGISLK